MDQSLREGVQADQYVVTRVLPENRGGFAQVVYARRPTQGGAEEEVALKFAIRRGGVTGSGDLDDPVYQALNVEVETLRELRHPGIARIYPILSGQRVLFMARAAELRGQPWYFVMERLAGGSVEALVRGGGRLEIPLAVEIAQQVAATLDYVHARGFAHLDIKASNVLLRRPLSRQALPEAVLVDFGTAQRAARTEELEAGTLVYAPPERVKIRQGQAPPETFTDKPAADVYSLGITFYRMLTGRLPFEGREPHIITAILNQAPTLPSQYNRDIRKLPDLDNLILQMLDKQPANRPKAREVVARLEQLVPSPRLRLEMSADPSGPPGGKPTPRLRGFVIALAFVALVGTNGFTYLWASNRLSGATPTPIPSASLRTGIVTAPATATGTIQVAEPTQTPAPRPTTVTKPPATTLARTPTPTVTRETATETPPPSSTPVNTFTPAPTPTRTPTPSPQPVSQVPPSPQPQPPAEPPSGPPTRTPTAPPTAPPTAVPTSPQPQPPAEPPSGPPTRTPTAPPTAPPTAAPTPK
jgi:serine/threonine-protein kinase